MLADALTPRVLVLMATYNGALWITEQLMSVLGQRGVNVCVRICDDQSNDGTADIVRRLAARHANVALEERTSASGSAGGNFRGMLAGTDFAGYDYIALADQDDIWDDDHLLRGLLPLPSDSFACGSSCAVRTFGDGSPTTLAQSGRVRRLDFLFEGAGQGCTFVLTVEAGRRVQTLCVRHPSLTAALHYHDWLIYLTVRCSGGRWIFVQHPSVRYRQHGANEIGARSGAGASRRRLALIREGWYRRQMEAALALASTLAPGDAEVARFAALVARPHGPSRNLQLALQVIREGRRRGIDRLILGVSALAGWL